MLLKLGFLAILLVSSSQGHSSGDKFADCDANIAEIGIVQNRLIEVTNTSVVITYEPPNGFESCNFDYEMVYLLYSDMTTIVHNSSTTELIHQFNYVEPKLLCKSLWMQLTAILNNVRGDIYDNGVFTDKFEIFLGAIVSLEFVAQDGILTLTWTPPQYYESCPGYYTVELINSSTQEQLAFLETGNLEWTFDYGAANLYCTTVTVIVTAYMRAVEGGISTIQTKLGPPPLEFC